METELKNLIGFWGQYLPNEQTCETLQRACPNTEYLWDELSRRQWLRKGASGQYGLAPQALHFFEQSSERIPKHMALEILEKMCERVHTWNTYASSNGLSSIAAVAVWGSVARPTAIDHGDIDVCLVWRHTTTEASNDDTAPVVCDPTNRWDVEDKVEQWIAFHPLINISGVDQWEEFGAQSDFSAQLVYADELWSQQQNDGVPPHEAQTMRKYANTWLEIHPKCVKMYKR